MEYYWSTFRNTCGALPPTSKIHPIVHVSQLRLAAGFKGAECATLPSSLPESAYQFRFSKLEVSPRALVWFSRCLWNGPDYLTTSLLEKIVKLFISAFHSPLLQGPGNVNTPSPDQAQKNALLPDQALKTMQGARKRRTNVRVNGPKWVWMCRTMSCGPRCLYVCAMGRVCPCLSA